MGNRLLIIDDETRICSLLHTVAAGSGYDVFALDNPELFEQSFVALQPDIVMLDLKMQCKDGIELLRFLSLQTKKAGIIIISGEDERVINSSLALAGDFNLSLLGVFRKPFKVKEVRDKLRNAYEEDKSKSSLASDDLLKDLTPDVVRIYFQPRVNLESGKTIGIECLPRLIMHDGQLVYPQQFLSHIKKNKRLAKELIAKSIQALKSMNAMPNELDFYVNIPGMIAQDLEFPEWFLNLCKRYDVDTSSLILELSDLNTESNLMKSVDVLTRLRLKGLRLSINYNANITYSLINRLNLPFTEIKVDTSLLIFDQKNKNASNKIGIDIKALINSDINLVATRVENERDMRLSRNLGFQAVQGYYIGRELTVEGFKAWLEDWEVSRL